MSLQRIGFIACGCTLSGVLFLLVFLMIHSHEHELTPSEQVIQRLTDSSPHQSGSFEAAAVAADVAPCASVGTDVLYRMKGSAVDAAIAVLFCSEVVSPESSGLGGGAWFTIFDPRSGKATVVNAREAAPAHTESDALVPGWGCKTGSIDSIAIPGQLAGCYAAHQLFGRIPFHHLIQPAIDLAFNGFPVSRHLADAIRSAAAKLGKHEARHLAASLRHPVTGRLYREGDIMRRPDLAATLQVIQVEGRASLYAANGTLATKLIRDLQRQGSRMQLEDLVNYTAVVEEADHRLLSNGMHFYSNGLPGSGPLLGFMLEATLRSFNLTHKLCHSDVPLLYRHAIEVFKFAFAQRGFLGDPAFEEDVNRTAYESTGETLERLQSLWFPIQVAQRIKKMKESHPDPRFYQQPLQHSLLHEYLWFQRDQGSASVTVVAPDGSAVAVTSTINQPFGSFVLSPRTGILMNSQMDAFSSVCTRDEVTGRQNRPAAGKRPMASLAPAILTTAHGASQRVWLTSSASGGPSGLTAQALVMLKSLLFEESSLAEVVKEARVHHQLEPRVLQHEASLPREIRDSLTTYGHKLQLTDSKKFGSVTVARKHVTSGWDVAADPRRQGSVGGFD